MMREMKDHELERVVGGRVKNLDDGPGATKASLFDSTKFTDKHLDGATHVAPFLLPELNSAHKNRFSHPPRNLPGTQSKQPSKGGPFTFKTPRPERSEEVPLGCI